MNFLSAAGVPHFPPTHSPLISLPKILGVYSVKDQFDSISDVIGNNIKKNNPCKPAFYVVNVTAYSLQVATDKLHIERSCAKRECLR
jgi:hypothetical protein